MSAPGHPSAIFLMGPTASGKTALAVSLVERFPLEIISVDSALVYRGMDIGTAKPDAVTLARAPHHLLDIRDPTETYSAAAFCSDARCLMADIVARGRVPLLVGGTMLYFRALLRGLDDLPRADAALRHNLEAQADARGWPALHAELAEVDPVTAARLAPNDSQRIGRALEVFRLTGAPMSALLDRAQSELPCRALRRHARRGPDRRSKKPAAGPCLEIWPAVHARGRLPPGVGLSRWRHRPQGTARAGYRRHPPARQAPAHLAAFVARGDAGLPGRGSGGAGDGPGGEPPEVVADRPYSLLVDSTLARAWPEWKRMPRLSPTVSDAASCTTAPFSSWTML